MKVFHFHFNTLSFVVLLFSRECYSNLSVLSKQAGIFLIFILNVSLDLAQVILIDASCLESDSSTDMKYAYHTASHFESVP